VVITFVLDTFELSPLVTWNSTVGSERLMSVKPVEFKKINEDLNSLRSCGLVKKKIQGHFERVAHSSHQYDFIYVYSHGAHSSFSKIPFSSIAQVSDVEECCAFVDRCYKHGNHISLLPYFHGNFFLHEMLREQRKRNATDKAELLKTITSQEIFSKESAQQFSSEYNEDQWSERLCECLKFNKIDCVCTAYLRGDHVEQAWKDSLPKGVSKKSLVFRGAPDIIIKNIKDENSDGYFAMESGPDEVEDCSSDSESEHSSRFQIGFQMPNIRPYKGDSFIPSKAGELVGAIHLSLVCRALRRYTEGKIPVYPLVGHGLQIHKNSGIIHFELFLSEEKLRIKATNIFDGQLTPPYLCSAIQYFIGKLKRIPTPHDS